MEKISFKPGTMLNPVPVVMVSCGADSSQHNIITIAWTGIINSEPPMTYVSVRKSRYSHAIIKETGEFVINLCDEKLAFATDYCGVKSGRDVNKFKEQKLTPVKAEIVNCPMIGESPVNLECKVTQVLELPTHDMFIAEIVKVHADKGIINDKGKIQLEKADLICYNHGEYFGIKRKPIGKFGYSIMKSKTRRRIHKEKLEERKKVKDGKNKKYRS